MDIYKEKFERIVVCGIEMLFTPVRIKKDIVPAGLYHYEVRHDDEDSFNPCQIWEWIMVNHYGTLISKKPLKLFSSLRIRNSYRDINCDAEWEVLDGSIVLEDYINWKLLICGII